MENILEFIIYLKNKEVFIQEFNGQLKVTGKLSSLTGEDKQILAEHKGALLSFLESNSKAYRDKFDSIKRVDENVHYDLSSAQKRFWVLSQTKEGSVAYNMSGVYVFEGNLDRSILSYCFATLIRRHEILRTVFKENEQGIVKQYIQSADQSGFDVSYVDLRTYSEPESELERLMGIENMQPFNLSAGPLLRVIIYQLDEQKCIFSYTMHHIISDGWSMEIIIKELLLLYNARLKGENDPLIPLTIQYKDYAAWQLEQLNGNALNEHKSYWLKQLEGELPVLLLPLDKPRPLLKTYNGGLISGVINAEIFAGFKAIVQEHGATLFMGLLAAANILLQRYTDQRDIIIGTPGAGRDHIDLENQIGLYVNTIALRTRIAEEDAFEDLIRSVKKVSLDAYRHQMYPFDELVSNLNIVRDSSRSVLFDVLLDVQSSAISSAGSDNSLADLKVSLYEAAAHSVSKFDVSFVFVELEGTLNFTLEYNSDLFFKETAARLHTHFINLLEEIINKPSLPVNKLNFLSSEEQQELLLSFNEIPVSYSKDKTVLALMEEQALKTPGQIALVFNEERITYRQLNDKSNQLADYLRQQHDIKPGDLVGIMLSRSEKMIIAILGILKAGAAYVPVEVDYPEERKKYIINDAGIKVLLTESSYIFDLEYYTGAVFAMDVQYDSIASYATSIADVTIPDHPAYVIYTSGSTGHPKGCTITMGNLSNYVQWANGFYFESAASANFGLFSSLSFDLTVTSIFCALTQGGTLYIYEQEDGLPRILEHSFGRESNIHCIKLTPSHITVLKGLNISSTDITLCIIGGEEVTQEHVRILKGINSNMRIYNEYGPTETTVGCIVKELEPDAAVLIGKPIGNTQVYILDAALMLCPVNVPGEICISGAGVGNGYLNNPSLTAAKFISNPFKDGERLYKTGDYGRWLPDGNIAFIGRKDEQVKLHGYRIESGEIEKALQGHPGIDQSVVLIKKDETGNKELVAYISGDASLNVTDIRSYLGGLLPAYMLPAHYIRLNAFPLTVNGKIDKKALPSPATAGIATGTAYVEARNDQERQLVSVCEEVLRKNRISIKDDFFALGGDSIKSIQVVSRLKQRGYALTIQDVMLHPVLEELATFMSLVSRSIDQDLVEGIIPLSPIQLNFFQNSMVAKHHFNQSMLLYCSERIREDGLKVVLDKIILHHDALRMVYRMTADGWIQENRGALDAEVLELVEGLDETGYKLHCDRIQSGMDLSSGPLFKVCLFRMPAEDRLLLVAHHLVVDGVSWRILFDDLSQLYHQCLAGETLQLPLKTDSFAYWQSVQLEFAKSEQLKQEEAYWSRMENSAVPALPLDYPGGTNQISHFRWQSFQLDKATTDRLLTECYKSYRTEINDILVTALSLSLREMFGMEKVLLGMEGHGRENISSDVDVTRTVGWFTTMYPVLLDMSNKGIVHDLIAVKEILHRVPNKGIGYGILRYLSGKDYHLQPEIKFNYLGDFSAAATGEDDTLFRFSGNYHGPDYPDNMELEMLLNLDGMIVEGTLRLSMGYSTEQYKVATIERLMAIYERTLRDLIELLAADDKSYLSPVDLTYKELSIENVLELNERYGIEDVYPLSPLQEGLYYHWSGTPASPVYFEEISYGIQGELDPQILAQAYERLVSRHAVLRTFFSNSYGNRSLQIVKEKVKDTFSIIDISDDKTFSISDFKAADRFKGFDLQTGPMMRLTVLYLGNSVYEFIWSHHHILMDGWCGSILIKEFFQIYHSLVQGNEPVLDKVYPYSAYINWLSKIDNAVTLDYWKNYLSGYNTLSGFPKKDIRDQGEYRFREQILLLDGPLRQSMKDLCIEIGITENTFIQTAWGMLLSRYNNTGDVVFGAVVSGRPGELEGVEEMIGLFSNTIPVRVRMDNKMTVRELLKEVQRSYIEGTDHHYAQLAEVMAGTALGGNLFDHILIFENYPVRELVERSIEKAHDGKALTLLSSDGFKQSHYDFTVTIVPGDAIKVEFNYNECAYDDTQMSRLQEHLRLLIQQLSLNVDQQLSELNFLSNDEKQQLLFDFNNNAVSWPADKNLVDLFEEQVQLTPDNVAVVFEETSLTYRALSEQSNRLANYLIANYQPQPDELIGVMLNRSEKMIIAILGILKSGAAYVPVDPDYPASRKEYIINDAGMQILLTQTDCIFDLEYYEGALIAIDVQLDTISASPELPGTAIPPENLAYVIYTSGSTGQPKGVMIEHASIVNTIFSQRNIFKASAGERHLQFASLSFDASVSEIFVALASGASLYIPDENTRKNPVQLSEYITACSPDLATLPPAYLKLLKPGGLKRLVTAGDIAMPDEVISYVEGGKYYNAYGPTECSICASVFEMPEGDRTARRIMPIGQGIANTRIYILDSNAHLMPSGITGEICIGGTGVGRGYLNNPDLTAEKFIESPFIAGERIYRTGDYGRWLPDGNIEFLGRMDEQIKLHGYRIELAEIERALQQHPDVERAIVLAKKDNKGEGALVAYVSGTESFNIDDVRSYLKGILPAYMLPVTYIRLTSFPLTANGKVDKKALPSPENTIVVTGKAFLAPRNETEEKMLLIWQEILDRELIGVRDNFFELGGHSLKAMRLLTHIHREWNEKVNLEDFFNNATIENISKDIQRKKWVKQTQKENAGLVSDKNVII